MLFLAYGGMVCEQIVAHEFDSDNFRAVASCQPLRRPKMHADRGSHNTNDAFPSSLTIPRPGPAYARLVTQT
jgi:hypothetical protein